MIAVARRLVNRAPNYVRRMSGGANVEEEIKEMNKWKIVTYAAIPLCGIKAFFDLSHSHEHKEAPDYPYLRSRLS